MSAVLEIGKRVLLHTSLLEKLGELLTGHVEGKYSEEDLRLELAKIRQEEKDLVGELWAIVEGGE